MIDKIIHEKKNRCTFTIHYFFVRWVSELAEVPLPAFFFIICWSRLSVEPTLETPLALLPLLDDEGWDPGRALEEPTAIKKVLIQGQKKAFLGFTNLDFRMTRLKRISLWMSLVWERFYCSTEWPCWVSEKGKFAVDFDEHRLIEHGSGEMHFLKYPLRYILTHSHFLSKLDALC